MDNIMVGTIVKSIAGHDQDNLFVIVNVENEYVYLVDGKTRLLSKPKKKKLKHIQVISSVNETFVDQWSSNLLLDSHVKKIIRNELKKLNDVHQ